MPRDRDSRAAMKSMRTTENRDAIAACNDATRGAVTTWHAHGGDPSYACKVIVPTIQPSHAAMWRVPRGAPKTSRHCRLGLHRSVSTHSTSRASAAGARHWGNEMRTFGLALVARALPPTCPRPRSARQRERPHSARSSARLHDERLESANVTCHCLSISFAGFHFSK